MHVQSAAVRRADGARVSAVWRWVRVRGAGSSLVHHAVQNWPQSLDTACGWQGREERETEIGVDGEEYCLACRRKLLSSA